MCGILGIYGPSVDRYSGNFGRALESIKHRGPNHQASLTAKQGLCMLGHTRLTILDPNPEAHQPMVNDKGIIIYNGEIYNHESLRSHLNSNHSFRTHSDTETLLIGLQEQGEQFFSLLEGMYAGAYFNKDDTSLLLFRDPVGIKPLFYCVLPDSTLVFSSEIKAILALVPDFSRKVNRNSLSTYMAFENWPQGATLIEGIYALPPGQMIHASQTTHGQIKLSLTALPLPTSSISFDLNSIEETSTWLRGALEKTISEHLLSDYPVACYLSGGLDSGTIATLAARANPNLHAYCGYFEGKNNHFDERHDARAIANHSKINLHEVKITSQDFQENFTTLIQALDEPRMGMGSFSQFMVAQAVAKNHKVVLAGHGGDELFYGYPLHKATQLISSFLSGSYKDIFKLSARELPWVTLLLINKMKKNTCMVPTLFSPKYITHKIGIIPDKSPFSSNSMSLSDLDTYYWNTYLPGLLRVEDGISMYHGLETRVPLCDYKLQQTIRQIPTHTKLMNNIPKGLFKHAIKDWLPSQALSAPKKGFPTPLRHWFKEDLKDYIQAFLLSPSPMHEFISKADILALLKMQQSGSFHWALDERSAHKIWILLSLKVWMDEYEIIW